MTGLFVTSARRSVPPSGGSAVPTSKEFARSGSTTSVQVRPWLGRRTGARLMSDCRSGESAGSASTGRQVIHHDAAAGPQQADRGRRTPPSPARRSRRRSGRRAHAAPAAPAVAGQHADAGSAASSAAAAARPCGVELGRDQRAVGWHRAGHPGRADARAGAKLGDRAAVAASRQHREEPADAGKTGRAAAVTGLIAADGETYPPGGRIGLLHELRQWRTSCHVRRRYARTASGANTIGNIALDLAAVLDDYVFWPPAAAGRARGGHERGCRCRPVPPQPARIR